MNSVVVDIDDTIIDTQKRVRSIWNTVLERDVPLETTETLSSRQILEKFGSSDTELWNRFWRILLCTEDSGIQLLNLDEPIPYAADVLQEWSRRCEIIYLTGRPENTRELTLDELRRFGFPTDGVELLMFDPQDWNDFTSVASLVNVRSRVLSSITGIRNIIRVIDDYPNFFKAYRQLQIPDRVGLLRPKRFSPQDYLREGATRVVESWNQLQDQPSESSS